MMSEVLIRRVDWRREPHPAFTRSGTVPLRFAILALAGLVVCFTAGSASGQCTTSEIFRAEFDAPPELVRAIGGGATVSRVGNDLLVLNSSAPAPTSSPDGKRYSRVVGVLLRGTADPILVPSPLPHDRVARFRASPRPGGGWDVTFTEFGTGPSDEGAIGPAGERRVWYAQYDQGWSSLRSLPVPQDLHLLSSGRSALVRTGSSLHWFVGAHGRSPALVWFVRERDEWQSHVLGVPGTGYPAVVAEASELWAAVVGSTTPGEVNSLFLAGVTDAAEPRFTRVIFGSDPYIVYFPVLARWRGGLALSWVAERPHRTELWTLPNVLESTTSGHLMLRVVDRDAAPFTSFALSSGHLAWLTTQLEVPGSDRTTLEFTAFGGDRVLRTDRVEPIGHIVGMAGRTDEAIVVGVRFLSPEGPFRMVAAGFTLSCEEQT